MDPYNIMYLAMMPMITAVATKMVERMSSGRVFQMDHIRNAIHGWQYPVSVNFIHTKITTRHGPITDNETRLNLELIEAISSTLAKTSSASNGRIIKCADVHTAELTLTAPVEYGGMLFIPYHERRTTNDTDSNDVGITIRGSDMLQIQSFVERCVNEHIARTNNVSNQQSYYIHHSPVVSQKHSQFARLPYVSTVSFDDIFFREKTAVVNSIRDLMTHRISKLGLFLHGPPGCGKTSMIKAIANMTKYSIVEIKPRYVIDDNDLKQIFFNPEIWTDEAGSMRVKNLPLNKRIYIIEEIDVEICAMSRGKSAKTEKSENARDEFGNTVKTSAVKPPRSKITLADMLTVLDGVIAIDGSIVIMTSNHPEKVDPALIRFGRVTYNLRMGPMHQDDAADLIAKYHPDWTGTVPADMNPAQLEVMCKTLSRTDLELAMKSIAEAQ